MDPFTSSALISAGASMLGGVMGNKAQKDANVANKNMLYRQQRFQEHMSNTAYQRSRKDMIKAGINPMLAVAQGGASSPTGGSAAQMVAEDSLSKSIGNATSSALEARTQHQQLENLKSQESTIKAQGDKAKAEKDIIDASLPAAKAKSQLEATRAKYDKDYVKADSWLNRINSGGAALNKFFDLFRSSSKSASPFKSNSKKPFKPSYKPKKGKFAPDNVPF